MPETLTELSKLRVVDLKQRLVEVGLPVGGLKAELVNRLHQYLNTPNVHEGNVSSSNASEEQDIGHSEKEKAPGTGAQLLSISIETLSPPVPAISPFCDADATAVLPSKPVLPTPAPLEQEPVLQQSPSALVPLQPPVPVLQNLHPPPLLKTPSPSVSLLQSPPATILQHASASPLLNIPSVQTVSSPATKPPALMSIAIEPPPSLDQELLMQQKVRQQQLLLEQQQISQKQDDLFRLQQQALLEKQRDENEKQAHLLRLQHEALKQNEDEQAQLQALGLKHGSGASSAEDTSTTNSGKSGCTSSVAGVGALMAALQQRQQPPPSILGTSPLIGGPGPGLLQRPPPRPQPHVGLMGHAPPLAGKLAVGGAQGEAIKAGLNERMSVRTARPPPQIGVPPVSAETSRPRHQVHSEEKPPPLMSLQVSAPADDVKDVRLPQALEEALAYKHERAKEVGVILDEDEDVERSSDNEDKEEEDDDAEERMEFNEWMPANTDMRGHQEWSKTTKTVEENGTAEKEQEEEEDEEEDGEREDEDRDVEIISSTKTSKKDKIKKKRKKKKKKKKANHSGVKSWVQKQFEEERLKKEASLKKKRQPVEPSIDVRYVQEEIELDYSDPIHRHFAKIFENFKISEPVAAPVEEVKKEATVVATPAPPINLGDLKKVPKLAEDTQDDSDNEDDNKPKISKRKLKLLRRMSIAELKQTVGRPDVVEMHDVTARDPKLLVHLKATRNTVPVPRHWCFKRKYLQGKRGIEKPPFELPDFIKRTGIMEMRAALQEKEDQKTLKAKMRDKVRPKMGKIDIDYQKLHDAFFKWQCKPEMTIHGDLYYEGKEFETKMKDKKPGEMSDDLRIALGMPIGANAHKVPPPWLIAMQRYGPPPSYPNLKIPGLNAPIPEGCSFGYHAGGWGKPPVDNMGKPIYGDVFGTQNKEHEMPMVEEEVEKSHWGELESESEEESEEESSEEEEEDTSGLVTPGETGLVTPSGISSLPAGLETPDMIELRKKHLEPEVEGGETPALYTILPERRAEGAAGRAMMASTHTYDLSAAMGGAPRQGSQGVEVALDPSELDLVDTDAMAARYEATIREQQAGDDQDFSDMVAEHAAKQRNKRRRLQNQDQNKPAKKYKDFKF